ncbi:MAG: hypothetical protein WC519_01225 [Parcubacteria group bacterium]
MNFGLQSLVSDIAVAMFKVAAAISHQSLKSELENLAISIAANPNADNIFRAENVLTLGREVGEIKPINAVVLIRELESLRRDLLVLPKQSENKLPENVDIASKFVHSASTPTSNQTDTSKPQTDISRRQADISRQQTDNTATSVKKTRPNNHGRKATFDPVKVLQFIAGHNMPKLKDMEMTFTEISSRTVRRTIENLMKQGKIERVGTPGPNSYYRVVSISAETAPIPVTPRETEQNEDIPQLSYNESPEVIAL